MPLNGRTHLGNHLSRLRGELPDAHRGHRQHPENRVPVGPGAWIEDPGPGIAQGVPKRLVAIGAADRRRILSGTVDHHMAQELHLVAQRLVRRFEPYHPPRHRKQSLPFRMGVRGRLPCSGGVIRNLRNYCRAPLLFRRDKGARAARIPEGSEHRPLQRLSSGLRGPHLAPGANRRLRNEQAP